MRVDVIHYPCRDCESKHSEKLFAWHIQNVMQCSKCKVFSSLAEVDYDAINRPCGCGGRKTTVPWAPAYANLDVYHVLQCSECKVVFSLAGYPRDMIYAPCGCGGELKEVLFSSINKQKMNNNATECSKCWCRHSLT